MDVVVSLLFRILVSGIIKHKQRKSFKTCTVVRNVQGQDPVAIEILMRNSKQESHVGRLIIRIIGLGRLSQRVQVGKATRQRRWC